MRKIPRELEHPLDDWLINLGEWLGPYFRKLNLTANHLTTVSLFLGVLSIGSYLNGQYIASSLLLLLSYAFDCFDGNYARRYGMTSYFGDLYDHIKDILVIGLLYLLIVFHYWARPDVTRFLPLVVILLILMCGFHMGCQERYYGGDREANSFLSFLTHQCTAEDLKGFMHLSRFCGLGSVILTLMILIWMS